jgi:predicted SAM-dependent methyltransferase
MGGIGGLLRGVKHRFKLGMQRRALRAMADGRPARIIIGTSGTGFTGWIGTDREVLDLLHGPSWEQYFSPDRLDAILAEHVWEHLKPGDAAVAARVCHRFLKPGGYLRVAVPDGFHPDPAYVQAVKPGGSGWGSDDHKVLYTYRSFSELFIAAGFEIRLLEYFDESGSFVRQPWSPEQGMIRRSERFDVRNTGKPLAYTSIVLDACKPARR